MRKSRSLSRGSCQRGMRGVLLLASLALLAGCVITPSGAPDEYYRPQGLVLEQSGTVVLLISAEAEPVERREGGEVETRPIASRDALVDAFTEGFHKLRPDANVRLADDTLRKPCFPASKQIVLPNGADMLIPQLSNTECRALAESLGVRYLILVGGEHAIASSKGLVGGFEGVGVEFRQWHSFSVYAWTFDAVTGQKACERQERTLGEASQAFGLGMFVVPLFFGLDLNEAAFWKAVAYQAGYRTAGCFMPITPSGTGATDELIDPRDDFVNCYSGGVRVWTYRSRCDK